MSEDNIDEGQPTEIDKLVIHEPVLAAKSPKPGEKSASYRVITDADFENIDDTPFDDYDDAVPDDMDNENFDPFTGPTSESTILKKLIEIKKNMGYMEMVQTDIAEAVSDNSEFITIKKSIKKIRDDQAIMISMLSELAAQQKQMYDKLMEVCKPPF